jgi:hypothetical protein
VTSSTVNALATWEAGLGASEGHRALLLHALARPGDEVDRLLDAPVGARDADLIGLRQALFGHRAPVRLGCERCGEELEFELDLPDLIGPSPEGTGEVRELAAGDWRVRWRPPTVGDLLAAADAVHHADGEDAALAGRWARAALLARCALSVTHSGRPADPSDLPTPVQERLADAAAEADPAADVRLDVPCPECGHRTKAVLDIASCLWAELDTWARGTLLDVHLLARAYGWTEPDVLALSSVRRRYYLELAGHA